MNLLLVYYLSIILLFTSNISAQENYLYENISVADGLSSARFSFFNTIHQDRYGFLWFGTVDGLNRYDGYNFKVYKNIPGDTSSLPSSNIQNINEDAEGNLWIGTAGYMSVLNRKTDSFENYPIDQGSIPTQQNIQIFRSLLDSKGDFWICTAGRSAQKWDKVNKRWELIPLLTNVDGVDTLVSTESSSVTALTELRNGNLLCSSFSKGIFYYNENSKAFEMFRFAGHSQPIGIVSIYEDIGGSIWLLGRNSFIEYNPVTFAFEPKEDWLKYKTTREESFFWDPVENKDGSFLVCSMPLGLMKYDLGNEKFTKVEVGGDLGERGIGTFAQSIYIDKFGVYWIGLADNGLLKFDPNRRPFQFYSFDQEGLNNSDPAITTDLGILSDKSSEVIVSTNSRGFFKFSLKNKSFQHMNIPVQAVYSDSGNLNEFVFDDENRMWFPSSRTMISYYDPQSGKSKSFKVLNRNMHTGNNEIITDLEYLPKDYLIISSPIGAYIFNMKTEELSDLPSTANRKYDADLLDDIRKIISTEKSIAAFTKVGEAANLTKQFSLKEKTDVMVVCLGEGYYPVGIFDYGSIYNDEGNTIWSMSDLNETFYAGGGQKNILKINVITLEPGDYTLTYNTDVGHSYANFNVRPPQDSTWYGIQVIELNGEQAAGLKSKIDKEISKKSFPQMYAVNTTLSSRKYPNNLWIGVNEKGIVKYNMATKKYEQYFLEDIKNSQVTTREIFEDSKGILWITYNPSGFYRFNPETKEFTSNASIQDLPLTSINGMIEDFQGSLWISSSGGITKLSFNKENNHWSTSRFDNKDGVTGGFGGGSIITRDGQIVFGSLNGVTAFYPSSENTSTPIPIISNIIISDVSVFEKDNALKLDRSIFDTDQITLSYDQNDISFEFSSIHYSRPTKNRVSYKLEDFNDNWIFTDKNFASFTNLEPGEYEFKVKAYSGYGVVSNSDRVIKLIVNPPWYRTTAAYIGYGLLFIGIIFGIDRIQRKRLLAKERSAAELKEAELRAQIAETESERKTKELEEARNLQLSMLPKKLPQLPNLDIAVYMKTATEVGGDYYDFHVDMDGTLTVVLGDATGHGMKAGTMVTSAKSLFNVLAPNPNILMTFHEMTRCLKLMHLEKLSMCMTMLKLKGNSLQMSAAGMPPVFIYKKDSRVIEEYVMKGMPLGTIDDFPYDIRKTTLEAGDTVLVMSDGLPELMNNEKQIFGYKNARNKFEEVAEGTPEQIIDFLKNEGIEWSGSEEPDDDVTFVVIKVK